VVAKLPPSFGVYMIEVNMFSFLDKMYGRSPKWRKVRAEHIKKHPECAACGRKESLEVHHIVPYHINPELELEPSNLITLCGKYCHFIFGHLMDWKSWNENVVRDCTLYHISKSTRPYKEEIFGEQPKERANATFSFIFSYFTWPFRICSGRNDRSNG